MGNSPAPLQAMSCAVVGGFQQLLEMGWFDEKGLCGHLGLGVHNLEAGLLPCNALLPQVPELLRRPSQLCGSQLRVSKFADRKVAYGLDDGNTSGLQVCHQSES